MPTRRSTWNAAAFRARRRLDATVGAGTPSPSAPAASPGSSKGWLSLSRPTRQAQQPPDPAAGSGGNPGPIQSTAPTGLTGSQERASLRIRRSISASSGWR